MNKTDLIEQPFLRNDIPDLRPGDSVKVHVRVVEGNRERVQVFQGVLIRRKGRGINEMIVVRRVVDEVGIQRTFPIPSLPAAHVASLSISGSGSIAKTSATWGASGSASWPVPQPRSRSRPVPSRPK